MAEMVNHPSHYNREGRKECIEEMVDIFGYQATMDFCRLNAYKYRYRAGLKGNGDEDLRKARWYDNKYLELSEKVHKHFV